MTKIKNEPHPGCRRTTSTSTARKAALQGNLGRQHIRGTRLPYHVFNSRLGLALWAPPKIVRVVSWETEFWGKRIQIRQQQSKDQVA